MLVCLKRPKINEKEARVGHLKKDFVAPPVFLDWIRWQSKLVVNFNVSKASESKLVKQEVSCSLILPIIELSLWKRAIHTCWNLLQKRNWLKLKIRKNFILFFKRAIPGLFFLYFCLFYKQLTVNKCSIRVANDWIRTRVLWYWKRPLCQLRHNHCPFIWFFAHSCSLHFRTSLS